MKFISKKEYKQQAPTLVSYNPILIISDGCKARYRKLSDDLIEFKPWKNAVELPYEKSEFNEMVYFLLEQEVVRGLILS